MKWLVTIAMLSVAGCANGGSTAETGSTDEWSSWGDAGAACGFGQHLCGGACTDDLPNDPANGCRRGCGDPCDAPDGVTAACSPEGHCAVAECVPRTCEELGAACGALDDGCGGTLECGTCGEGTACVDGACSCAVDEAEENEVQAQAFELAEASDAPRTEMVVDAYALHAVTDVDWYRVAVRDGFDGSNPTVTVTLADAAPGYVIGAWYVCNSGGDDTTCEHGAASNYAGRGCSSNTDGTGATSLVLQSSCTGSDESGVLLVRVMAEPDAEFEACTPYRLGITVD